MSIFCLNPREIIVEGHDKSLDIVIQILSSQKVLSVNLFIVHNLDPELFLHIKSYFVVSVVSQVTLVVSSQYIALAFDFRMKSSSRISKMSR